MYNQERYNRQLNLKGFGKEAQQKLYNAKVLVIGAGGLGIPALQYLVAMGIGTIGIADGDTISISNLNRQVLYTEAEAGLSKVEVIVRKLSIQNPGTNFQPIANNITTGNALEVINNYDLVIDATDNFESRYLINDVCVILNKPFIYGAINKFEGQLSVFNFNDGPTYRCLYPVVPGHNETKDCNETGVLGVVPGIVGCWQALEAVKVITGIGTPLSGKVKVFDFLNNEEYLIELKTVEKNKRIKNVQSEYGNDSCSNVLTVAPSRLYELLQQDNKVLLVDVREIDEFKGSHLKNSMSIPLNNLNNFSFEDLHPNSIILICQKGNRSKEAAKILSGNNATLNVFSLDGGIENWQEELGDKLVVS